MDLCFLAFFTLEIALKLYGFGAAVGFSLVLILFAAMRERLAVADVPRPFRGAAIAMIMLIMVAIVIVPYLATQLRGGSES